MKKIIKWVQLSFLVFFFAFLSIQFYLWKELSIDATYYLLKATFYDTNESSLLKLGGYCNTLKDYECAEKYFKKAVYLNPLNKTAVANLAMSYSRLKKWAKSESHYQAYFSMGGTGFDVMYWYAKTLQNLSSLQDYKGWYYLSLSKNPSFFKAPQSLIEQLLKEDKVLEAMSVIGGVNKYQPNKKKYWFKLLNQSRFNKTLQVSNKENSFMLASIKDAGIYVPVWLEDSKRMELFKIDLKGRNIIINR